jgi:hypothetical protein
VKLPVPARDARRDLDEFDIWITPSLGEITETDKFKEELARVTRIFEELGKATNNFKDESHCEPGTIARTFARIASGQSETDRAELFKSLASTLYLVTGETDNNSKCQFPLFLRDTAKWTTLPTVKRRSDKKTGLETKTFVDKPLPRTLESDTYMDLIASIADGAVESRLLEQIVSFLLLKGKDSVRQFWSIGYCYYALKSLGQGYERNLLSPMVIFKVRGSVSASGGHKPEEMLRDQLHAWGLIPDSDFNVADVIVDREGQGKKEKTRAYDFVLPYRTPGWAPEWNKRIMMQSQFYAGDSGSVSHKNVDQTKTSRERVLAKFADTRFVEYVDGAGYFSSLNSDLKKILDMGTTRSFIQIRSAPVRLRRELQALGFVTPLEIEHALVQSSGDEAEVGASLVAQGYHKKEVQRALDSATGHGIILRKGSKLALLDERREIVRQHLLLDILSIHGRDMSPGTESSAVRILVPGNGAFFGLDMEELATTAVANAGMLREEISDSPTFSADLGALNKRGHCMVGR